MRPSTPKREFWRGIRDTLPFIVVLLPFSILFGVVATEAGLSVFETLSFSVVVIAGAAQFTAIQLMQDDVPTLMVLVSSLAVNLRMAMYSASLTPYFGAAPLWQRAVIAYFTVDNAYAQSVAHFDKNPDLTMAERFAFFMGIAAVVAPLWYGATLVGALLGRAVPDGLALDFALPITFLALIAPMLRTPAHVVAALVSIVAALSFAFLPFNLGLLVAGLAGMMAGAETERRMDRGDAQ